MRVSKLKGSAKRWKRPTTGEPTPQKKEIGQRDLEAEGDWQFYSNKWNSRWHIIPSIVAPADKHLNPQTITLIQVYVCTYIYSHKHLYIYIYMWYTYTIYIYTQCVYIHLHTATVIAIYMSLIQLYFGSTTPLATKVWCIKGTLIVDCRASLPFAVMSAANGLALVWFCATPKPDGSRNHGILSGM